MSSLYPSLEDMKVDQMAQVFPSFITTGPQVCYFTSVVTF